MVPWKRGRRRTCPENTARGKDRQGKWVWSDETKREQRKDWQKHKRIYTSQDVYWIASRHAASRLKPDRDQMNSQNRKVGTVNIQANPGMR